MTGIPDTGLGLLTFIGVVGSVSGASPAAQLRCRVTVRTRFVDISAQAGRARIFLEMREMQNAGKPITFGLTF